jgi:hypothetical protein
MGNPTDLLALLFGHLRSIQRENQAVSAIYDENRRFITKKLEHGEE